MRKAFQRRRSFGWRPARFADVEKARSSRTASGDRSARSPRIMSSFVVLIRLPCGFPHSSIRPCIYPLLLDCIVASRAVHYDSTAAGAQAEDEPLVVGTMQFVPKWLATTGRSRSGSLRLFGEPPHR